MKKIVSVMALCVVLFGTVMMVTGCGAKPKAGTVWKVEKITVEGASEPLSDNTYYCFHSNGNAYSASKMGGKLYAGKLGSYTIDKKNITIKLESVEKSIGYAYTLKGEKMTFTGKVDSVSVTLELQKVSSPTESEIAEAAK